MPTSPTPEAPTQRPDELRHQGKSRHKGGNSRRNGYELTRQRDMLPIALGAGAAAVVLHIIALTCFPTVLSQIFAPEIETREVDNNDIVRLVVREKPEEEIKESPPLEEPPPEPREIVTAQEEEIDLLELEDITNLSIMPGETSIPHAQPAVADDDARLALELRPAALDINSLPAPELEAPAMQVPEPTPINSNDVIAKVEAMPEAAEEASVLMERTLREDAGKEGSNLPTDTRSLAELMGVENPGASSGVARFGEEVLFAFGKSQLKSQARITMLQLAALIHKNPDTNFIIEGHTDSFGGRNYNALLSLQRAAAVREWLVQNGVPVEKVYIRPCANSSPLVSIEGSREEQALNRRVEIHMRNQSEPLPPGCVPHTEKVDTRTPVSRLIARGARVPEAYASAFANDKDAGAKDAPTSDAAEGGEKAVVGEGEVPPGESAAPDPAAVQTVQAGE